MTQEQQLEIMKVFETARNMRDELLIACPRLETLLVSNLIDDEAQLHRRVAEERRKLAFIDAELFSIYGLLHKFRQQNHFSHTAPQHVPQQTFSIDDL